MADANTTNADGVAEELSPVKRALFQVRELRSKLEALENRAREPIAVVGMGLRFPGGANDPDSLWQILSSGVDVITETPPTRWNLDQYYDPDFSAPGKVSTRFGSYLEDVDLFDAAFFGISPREAESMDPQHRLLLEVAWETLERSGESPAALFGSQTGVFVGISNSDYFRMLLSDVESIDPYVSTGNLFSVAAGRLSYTLGLQGPNLALDTACSSSLAAMHLAVQSLRQGECDLALAGGVSLMLSPEVSINFSKAQMMAPDGRCKTFDAAADGYVRGEGCALIALKRLSDAVADQNTIWGIIRGTALNHDGRSGGLTAPNGPAQSAVIRQALTNAGVAPQEISYVETHGTGTSLGDPIEVRALIEALAQERTSDNPLMLGSVKTNLGHLEATAGIAGLLKVLLAFQHGQIPPHLHLQALNPHITLDGTSVVIPTELTPWPTNGERRLAGVSSFGLSGTNAHIIVEEAPPTQPSTGNHSEQLLTLSAKEPQALRDLANRYGDFLGAAADLDFGDICFTSRAGRSHFSHRLAVVAADAAAARTKLAAFVAGDASSGVVSGVAGNEPEVTFLFSGYGANYIDMGRRLFATEPVFRAALERCEAYTASHLQQPLLSVLYPELTGSTTQGHLLEQMTYGQVALFALQYGLAQVWRSWGVEPTFVMGHSAGEYAAACIAGTLTLEASLQLILARGQLFASMAEDGAMYAVFAEQTQVEAAVAPFADQVSIAAYNGPRNLVISGKSTAVEQVLNQLHKNHVKTRRLAIAKAAHSPLLDPLLPAFEQHAATLDYAVPRIGLVSTVTGELVDADEMSSAAYWRRHLRQPVRFQQGMETLQRLGQRIFVEIGPQPTLLALGERCLPAGMGVWIPSLRKDNPDPRQLLESLGTLYVHGVNVDWSRSPHEGTPRRIPLPTYPFQRKRYWTTVTPRSGTPRATPAAIWQAMTAAGNRQAEQGPLDLALSTYPAKWAALERLSTAYILNAYREMGAFCRAGEAYTTAELMARFAIQPVYTRLMQRWLERLSSANLLIQENDRFYASQPLPEPSLDEVQPMADATLADSPMILDYLRRCGPRLAAVLTGKQNALDTLFPNGSLELAEALYQHWAVSRYFAGLVGALLDAYVKTQADRPLRILEIGAGTGATTAALLPLLPAELTRYDFTDVSDLFLSHAATKFAAYPFVRFSRLDIEQAPQPQGFAAEQYDIIVATNVLHATVDLNATLAHVRSLLAPGGVLLINEATEHQAWLDITTSLIGGWQRFADNLRHDQPLLSRTQWLDVLQARSFENVAAWPAAGAPTEVLGQHVFVALAPQGQSTRTENTQSNLAQGSTLDRIDHAAIETPTPAAEFLAQLQAAVPDARWEQLLDFVRKQIVRVMRLEPTFILSPQRRLFDLGLDSLMALELRKLLSSGLGLPEDTLSATLIFDYPTGEAIVNYLLDQVLELDLSGDDVEQNAPAAPLPSAKFSGTPASIADLSDAEVEAMLLERVKLRRT